MNIIDLTRAVLDGLVTKFAESIKCLEAILDLDTWIGTSSGNRCRFCGSVWPDHVVDCPRQAAERFVQSLYDMSDMSTEEEE